jgi:hypothetical protein
MKSSACRERAKAARRTRKALSDKPAFQPYWGKPAVRKLRPVKTGVFSRRQTCRGKSQEPCSLDGRMAGPKFQNPEAHRQGLPWGGYESPGRNDSERIGGLEKRRPEGRARFRRAKAEWGAEI